MTDHHNELTIEQALRLVVESAAVEIDTIRGDMDIFTKRREIEAKHLEAVALAEQLAARDFAGVHALLPADYMSALALTVALGAVAVHLADGRPEAFADARRALIARLTAEGEQ